MMKQNILFIFFIFLTPTLFALDTDSTEIKSTSPVFYQSFNVLGGGGNKNYHDDSFYSFALQFEARSEYTNFMIEIENLINNETGYESCFGEPENYKTTYNTTYIKILFGYNLKYAGIDLSFSKVNQTRGWCENLLEFGFAFHGKIKLGLIDKYYITIGNSDNFRTNLTNHLEMFEMGFTYLFDKSLSNVRIKLMLSHRNWGIGFDVKKKINKRIILLGELYYYDEISITQSETTIEIFNFRIGAGYLFY